MWKLSNAGTRESFLALNELLSLRSVAAAKVFCKETELTHCSTCIKVSNDIFYRIAAVIYSVKKLDQEY